MVAVVTAHLPSSSLPLIRARARAKSPSPSTPTPSISSCCLCGRRHLLGASAVVATMLPLQPSSSAVSGPPDAKVVIETYHPKRPDWYESLYAYVLDKYMKSYESKVARYKAELFNQLAGDSKNILEVGVGTGPNLKYYASASDVNIFGVDPNMKMKKYARDAATAVGLPAANFHFIQGVAEALPVTDDSMDAVIGSLVLCSVKDTDLALSEVMRVLKPGGRYLFIEHVAARDGSFLKLVQSVLNPLQQLVSDGCHLTRNTGKKISEAGFSTVNLNTAVLSVPVMGPHVYGIAYK